MNKKFYSANFPLKDFVIFLLMYVGRTFKTLKINSEPFPPLFFLVFLIIEPVQFTGTVGDVGFQFAGIFEEVHGEEFLTEIAPVELDIEDGLIEVLQFPQREFFRQEAEAEGMFLDSFLEPFVADVE